MAEGAASMGTDALEAPRGGTVQPAHRWTFPDGAAKHWLLSSIIWLTVVDLFGLVLATQFVTPEAFGGLFYMLPRLVGTRGMWSERLGIWCAWAWNAAYLLGVVGLLTGHSQGREYGEFIWPFDIAIIVIWSLNVFNILATVAIRTIRPIYVSVWFFIASPLWLLAD